MSKRRGTIVSQHLASWAGGWYLMIYQAQFAATFNATVFFGGMLIAGIPGAREMFGMWLGARMASPPPPSPEPASSAESST